MLRDEVKLFERLSGESANDVTIVRLGSFLDGYFVGKNESVTHAHWVHRTAEWNFTEECSKCGYGHDYRTPFCPHCGARMDEEV